MYQKRIMPTKQRTKGGGEGSSTPYGVG